MNRSSSRTTAHNMVAPHLQLSNKLRNIYWSLVVFLLLLVVGAENQKIASLPGTDDFLEVGNPLIPRHIGSVPRNEIFAVLLGL